ncbi:MAG TPA: GAF and ANTAR domain-containing protein [Acidimicrobiales bacterium]|nr:GAF and ANTAR domain-containing protein [Acidimicrobiales bacterium]
MSEDARSQAMRALSQFLVSDASVGDTLLRVAEITTRALPAAEMAGISILDAKGNPTTAVFTDAESPEIDAGQYKSGAGPCLDAWRLQCPIRIDDMSVAASDYPDFARLAQERGVQSTLSLPLIAGDSGVGAMNLYAKTVRGFSEKDEVLGCDLAAAAAIVLANATAYWDSRHLGEQLTEAMQSRAVIEQAKGMLMAQSPGITADDAFDVLRRASQRENVKLRDIATRIVERRSVSTDG